MGAPTLVGTGYPGDRHGAPLNDEPRREPLEGGRGLLLIAAKEPVPGMAKTRLGATIGMARAAALYAAFLVDLAARFTPARTKTGGSTSAGPLPRRTSISPAS